MGYNKDLKCWEGFIYCITNKINNKQYIGQTMTTIEHRASQHFSTVKNPTQLIKKAIQKYGKENFTIEEVKKISCHTKDELRNILNEKEIYYIQNYNTYVKNGGYNLDKGGFTASYLSQKIDVYNSCGEKIKTFDSISEASRYYDVSINSIIRICNGEIRKNKTTQLVFRYYEEPFEKYNPNKTKRMKYTYKYNSDGSFNSMYNSITEAALSVSDKTRSSVIRAIKNKTLHADYYWSNEYVERFELNNCYGNSVCVDKYTLNGEYVGSYNTLCEACISVGKDISYVSHISKTCNGEKISAFGYIWRLHGQPFDLYRTERKHHHKPVNMYSLDFQYENTFESAKQASVVLDLTGYGNITNCCNGKVNSSYGHKWFYANDPNQPDKSKILS